MRKNLPYTMPNSREIGLGNLQLSSLSGCLALYPVRLGHHAQLEPPGHASGHHGVPNRFFTTAPSRSCRRLPAGHLKQVSNISHYQQAEGDSLEETLCRSGWSFLPTPADDSSATKDEQPRSATGRGGGGAFSIFMTPTDGKWRRTASASSLTGRRSPKSGRCWKSAAPARYAHHRYRRTLPGRRPRRDPHLLVHQLPASAGLCRPFSDEGVDRKLNVALTRARENTS